MAKKKKQVIESKKFKKRELKYDIPDPDRDWYTPSDLRGKDIKELKKLYTEMRDISQKRLKRMAEKYPDSTVLRYHPKSFPTIKELKAESRSEREFQKNLRHSLSDLSRFVQSPSTTLTGQKEISDRRLQILKDNDFFTFEDPETGEEIDLLDTLTDDQSKSIMRFVHWVQRTQHLNIMYRDEFAQKIKQSRFLKSVERSDYGKRNYASWYEQITGLKAQPVPRKKKKAREKTPRQSSDNFAELR